MTTPISGVLFKHRHVIDPLNQIDRKMDVAITAQKVAAVEAV